jgi:hypothetical protein
MSREVSQNVEETVQVPDLCVVGISIILSLPAKFGVFPKSTLLI